MSPWEEMIGDLMLDENLKAAFAVVLATPVSFVLACVGQLLKRLPTVIVRQETIPEFMAGLGLAGGFVASYLFDIPKDLSMMSGTLAGALSGRAYDYSGPLMQKIGPTGPPLKPE